MLSSSPDFFTQRLQQSIGARRGRNMPQSNNPDTARARHLTISQTARIVGVSSFILRLWENVGLTSPARTAGE